MEYALILVLVSVICIVVLVVLGDDIARTYETMLCEIEGGDNCLCDAREAFIVGPEFVCAGNSFSFQTLTSCRDRTELALKIDYPDDTSTTHGLVYDEGQGLFYTSFVSPSLCASIDGGTPPLGAVVSEHTDNEYLNTLPFSFSDAPTGDSESSGGGDTGGGDTGGGDTGGGDTGGGDTGGGDPGDSDPGDSDPGGSDTGDGGLPPGDDGDDDNDDEEALPPTLRAIDPVTMQETQPTTINFSATPPSGSGPVTFNAMNLTVTWMTFTDNGDNTATLTLEPERGHAGEYDVTIVATGDNDSSSSQAFSITVNAAPNRSPVITDIDDQTVEAGGTLEIPVTVSDDDGDDVSITVSGAAFVSESDNPIIATPDTSDVGPHTITVIASDGKGGTDSKQFMLTVTEAAQAGRVEDGLLALYRFDTANVSDNTIYDISGNAPAMNLTGNALRSNTNSVGMKNDNSYLTTDNATAMIDNIRNNNAFTIEMWIKPGNASQGGFARIFTMSQNTNINDRNISIGHGYNTNGNNSQNLVIRLRTGSGVTGKDISAVTFTDGIHHLVFMHDGDGQNRLYFDGQLVTLPNQTGWQGDLSTWSDYRLTLGNEYYTNNQARRPWNGEFFLVAIYNRALTEQEVMNNFDAAEPWK